MAYNGCESKPNVNKSQWHTMAAEDLKLFMPVWGAKTTETIGSGLVFGPKPAPSDIGSTALQARQHPNVTAPPVELWLTPKVGRFQEDMHISVGTQMLGDILVRHPSLYACVGVRARCLHAGMSLSVYICLLKSHPNHKHRSSMVFEYVCLRPSKN